MKVFRQKVRPAGFSLLELTVAAFMFAIVMAAVATAFFSAHKLRATNEADLAGVHGVRRALEYLKRDFRSATLPATNDTTQITTGDSSGTATPTNVFTFSGVMVAGTDTSGGAVGSMSLEFFSASGVRIVDQPWADIQRLNYYLRPPLMSLDAVGNELVRGVSRNLSPGLESDYSEQVLLGGVEQLVFEFWTGSEWVDYWDSTMFDPAAPMALRATLVMVSTNNLSPPVYQVTVPFSVEARTNLLQSATGGAA